MVVNTGSKTEAALILLAMNASHRLVRWLALLFRSLLLPLQSPSFSVDPIYMFWGLVTLSTLRLSPYHFVDFRNNSLTCVPIIHRFLFVQKRFYPIPVFAHIKIRYGFQQFIVGMTDRKRCIL